MTKINVFDIFHGGVYYVDEEVDANGGFAQLGFGGYVRFDALSKDDTNFVPMYPEGCWMGIKYDSIEYWEEHSVIEGAKLTWAAVLDMLDENGGWNFTKWDHGRGCAVLKDKERLGERRIELSYDKEERFIVKFVNLPDIFEENKKTTYDYHVSYLHELQRLMIAHGWGKKAMEIGEVE